MARKKRNFRQEYLRRIARGEAKGLNRAAARGHGRSTNSKKSRVAPPKSDAKIEAALRLMNEGVPMTRAAKQAQVSTERFRSFLTYHNLANKSGRRWVIGDTRFRRIPHITGATTKAITVPGFEPASAEGKHHNAVYKFITTGDETHLEPFRGKGVSDAKGRFHPFETDPNELYRYAAVDQVPFHEIYTIISN